MGAVATIPWFIKFPEDSLSKIIGHYLNNKIKHGEFNRN